MIFVSDNWIRKVSLFQNGVRIGLFRGRFLLTALATLCVLAAGWYIGPKLLRPSLSLTIIVTMLVYFLAHCFRAMRLCIISGPLLKMPARTIFLLHFATAPFAIIPPFKLGEIVRFYTLWTISRKLSETIVTVLLDRLFDAIILSLLLAWLIINDHIDSVMDESTRTVQWMILAVTISAGVCFLIGPRALSSLQRYVMIHHSGRNVLVSLRLIDVLRKGTTSGEGLLRQQGPLLMMITVLIWGLELVAAALFTPVAIFPEFHNAGVLLINRTVQEWHAAFSSFIDPALATSAASSILAIFIVWPPSVYGYLTRIITPSSRSQRLK